MQMALRWRGLPIYGQDYLYAYAVNHNQAALWGAANGGIDPSGLSSALNMGMANPMHPTNNHFSVFQSYSFEEMTRNIIGNVVRCGSPVPVLTELGMHWVLVRGAQTMAQPVQNSHTTIFGVWINDPWPPIPNRSSQTKQPTIPPHYDDDACGTGGLMGGAVGSSQYGWTRSCDGFMKYDTWWKNIYLTPEVYVTGQQAKYAAVFNGCVIKKEFLDSKLVPMQYMPLPEEWRIRPGDIIPEDKIRIRAIDMTRACGLHEQGAFAEDLVACKAKEPIMVQRIDQVESYYYLVPIEGDRSATIVTAIDAIDGDMLGAVKQKMPSEVVFKEKSDLAESLTDRSVYIDSLKADITLRKGRFYVHPIYVWKLCEESLSPFYPFRLITVGDKNFYVGYDGTIYDQLHDIKHRTIG